MNKFSYQKGILKTSIPWEKPSKKIFDLWLRDFLAFNDVSKYEVWLCGGFLEQQWETWDIDIILTGPPHITSIEKLLIDGQLLGLYKYNLLIDLQYHYSKLRYPFTKKRAVKKIVIYDKIIKNDEILTDLTKNPTLKKINEYLWEVTRDEPSSKQIQRIKQGFFYTQPPLLLYPTK